MKRIVFLILLGILILAIFASAVGQGRGRGLGLGRKSDVFVNGHDARSGRWNNFGGNASWKCGKFVNCHDARDGRWDGRGPRSSSSIFYPRRHANRAAFERARRFDRFEMLRQERIAERRYFANRYGWRRP